jgi:hypothetical protein
MVNYLFHGKAQEIVNDEDILVYPDGEWCLRCEVDTYNIFNLDYDIIRAFTAEWEEFMEEHYKD